MSHPRFPSPVRAGLNLMLWLAALLWQLLPISIGKPFCLLLWVLGLSLWESTPVTCISAAVTGLVWEQTAALRPGSLCLFLFLAAVLTGILSRNVKFTPIRFAIYALSVAFLLVCVLQWGYRQPGLLAACLPHLLVTLLIAPIWYRMAEALGETLPDF